MIQHRDISLDILAKNYFTALHYTSTLNKEGSVKLLVNAQANSTLKSKDGHGAADHALQEAENIGLYDRLKQAEKDWIVALGSS
ncbi:MAG: hypothetical protein JKY80_09375 [Mariprofundaceae bacterium]|nr:hypothetical protein [Mariprofundaceae bacterium]